MITIRWDDREVRRALDRMRRLKGHFGPALKALKKPFREDLKAHAQRQEGPDGKWPKRSTGTDDRYRHRFSKRKTPTLKKRFRRRSSKLLGRLPTAVTFRSEAAALAGISKVPWSEVHNTGGRVGRGALLPAREFLFISDAFHAHAADELAAYVVKEWGRA